MHFEENRSRISRVFETLKHVLALHLKVDTVTSRFPAFMYLAPNWFVILRNIRLPKIFCFL